MAISTPWGPSQSRREIAEGIVFYSTAGHGGIRLSPDRWAQFITIFPGFEPWAGAGWMEEDCDYSLVVLAFPEHFGGSEIFSAVRMVRSDREYFAKVQFFFHSALGATCLASAASHFQEIKDKWEVSSMGTHGKDWLISVRRVGDGRRASFVLSDYPSSMLFDTLPDDAVLEDVEPAPLAPVHFTPAFSESDCGGVFDGNVVTSDADPGL